MAKFQEFGIDDLELSIEEIAEIPNDSLITILKAGADVAVKAFKAKLQAIGHVRSGKLRDSIMTESKQSAWGTPYEYVHPFGNHDATITNEHLGAILEYGNKKRNMKASQWMKTASEECSDEVVAAEQAAYDDFLQSKGF